MRHDWFKDLLIELESEIDKASQERHQQRLMQEMEEESQEGGGSGKNGAGGAEEAYFTNHESVNRPEKVVSKVRQFQMQSSDNSPQKCFLQPANSS